MSQLPNKAVKSVGKILTNGLISKASGGLLDSGFGVLDSVLGVGQQKRLMDYQYRLQKQMMDDVREYNSPANMRSLYEKAGLNYQALMSGEGGSAGQTASSSMPSMSMPSLSHASMRGVDPLTIGMATSQMRVNDSQANLNDAKANEAESQVDVNKSQVDLNKSIQACQEVFRDNAEVQGALMALQLKFETETYGWRVDQVKANLDTTLKSLDILDEELTQKKFQNSLNPLQQQLLEETIKNTAAQTVSYMATAYYHQSLGDEAQARIPWIDDLAQAQVNELWSRARLEAQQREYTEWQTKEARRTFENNLKMQGWRNTGEKIGIVMKPIVMITECFKNVAVGIGALKFGGAAQFNGPSRALQSYKNSEEWLDEHMPQRHVYSPKPSWTPNPGSGSSWQF